MSIVEALKEIQEKIEKQTQACRMLAEALRAVEFAYNEGEWVCDNCNGLDAKTGRVFPRTHTEDCIVRKAIAQYNDLND